MGGSPRRALKKRVADKSVAKSTLGPSPTPPPSRKKAPAGAIVTETPADNNLASASGGQNGDGVIAAPVASAEDGDSAADAGVKSGRAARPLRQRKPPPPKEIQPPPPADTRKRGSRKSAGKGKATLTSAGVIEGPVDFRTHYVCPLIPSDSPLSEDMKGHVNPFEWEKLSEEKKAILVKLLPPCDKNFPCGDDGPDESQPPEIHPKMWEGSRFKWMSNQLERRIGEGRYELEYQRMVLEISRRRKAQEFEPFKDDKAERYWGQKRVSLSEAIAGESASVKFVTLARYHVLRIGDIFSLRRSFAGMSEVIEKEATFTEFDSQSGHMTFTYPPKRMKTATHGIENLTVKGITSPGTLERELVTEDGRGPDRIPNGNAFKSIHIVRNGEELGSIFELRSTFYQQYLAPNADEGPRKALEKELGLSPMMPTTKIKRPSGRSRFSAPSYETEDGDDDSKTPTRTSGRKRTTIVAARADDSDDSEDGGEHEGYNEKPKRKRASSSPRRSRKKRA